MANLLSALEQEAQKRNAHRPVLRGSSEVGNSLEDYERALRTLRGVNFRNYVSIDELYEWTSRDVHKDLVKARARLALLQPEIQDFHKGSQRTEGQRTIHWGEASYGIVSLQPLALLVISNARIFVGEDRAAEAANLLLDVAQMGADQWRNAGPVDLLLGMDIQNRAFDELKTLLISGRLGESDLKEIDRELELLDSSYPHFEDVLTNHAMITGFEWLRAGTVGAYLERKAQKPEELATWQFGFSDHLLMASAFNEILASMRRIAEGDQKPWVEASIITKGVDIALSESQNPLVRITASIGGRHGFTSLQEAVKECQTRLRLLRMATHYLAVGGSLELNDPFGSNICVSRTPHHITIWSRGRDGIDDGGTGGWESNKSKDIVLEINR